MANERDIVFRMRAELTLPFSYSLCDCYSWTTQQRLNLQKEVDTIKQSIDRLEADSALHSKCAKAEVLNGLVRNQK